MREHISSYVVQLNKSNVLSRRLRRAVAWCSLSVVLVVFWCLKLTGITLAGEAFCGQNEHIHRETCFTRTMICEREEVPGHTHSESCLLRKLVCVRETASVEEGDMVYHVADDSQVIVMEQHTHTEECWHNGEGFGCGLTEAEGHVHTAECLTEQTELDCGQEAVEGHAHGEGCFEQQMTCTLQEHVHEESCYCKLDADLETQDDWESIAAGIPEGSTTAANVVMLAESQLGYTESTMNFVVDDDLNRRGITRYGQWYGNPYGDWSAMFASFCLYYAGVEDAPVNAGPESMRLEWAAEDMYRPASEYAPRVGDVIFLRTEGAAAAEEPVMQTWSLRATEPAANTVALIKEISEDSITVIQGDVDGTVTEVTYPIGDDAVLGYGLVPEVSAYAARAVPSDETAYVAKTISYNSSIFTSGRSFVIYTSVGTNYYAINGAGKAVPVYIDTSGEITMDVGNRDDLLWSVTRNGDSGYIIRNRGTGMYLHPYVNSSSDRGALTVDQWPTGLTASGDGVLLRHTYNSAFTQLQSDQTAFTASSSQRDASIFRFGVAENCTVWLDGTLGGLEAMMGSEVTSMTVMAGDVLTLPSEWRTPTKYNYVLKGWYDVKNGRYYQPGDEVVVTEELLFYADWVAATYDIGEMNDRVTDTVSTKEFVTTRVFDYNALFNVLSTENGYTGGDSTSWTLVDSGAVRPSGEDTLNFIFTEYDSEGMLVYPYDLNQNNGLDYSKVTPDLYGEDLADILFNPSVDVIGKTYLGTADHLFQYGNDPEDEEHYGYYYYDSRLNAASYNQSNQRFYIYNYLERTQDSEGNDSYSDFLPLNSPYANTNENGVGVYTYAGVNGEYVGVNHIQYDTKYNNGSNAGVHVGTNFWFGMATELEFYLPAVPGSRDSEGNYANQSIVGDDMVFEFSGDDDVWVLIDDELVLDIGGIHQEESGYIDFSTGQVVVDGKETGTVTNLKAGSHKLTMYYLERGSSMSNFKLRFNLTTRYSMTLRKEDALTAHLLDGTKFSVYLDEDCIYPAELWESRAAYERGDTPTNCFEVTGGVATMWGFAAGSTYYLVETEGAYVADDEIIHGIVRMRLNNEGRPDYEVIPDVDGLLTVGFTVHGFKVNEDEQEAYLVITNTDATDSLPTEVYVEKEWADRKDHSEDTVTVYLMANGTRIQSVTLGELNDWKHTWTNLPSKDADGNPVTYTVREATVPGYVPIIIDIPPPSSGDSGGNSGSSSGSSSGTGSVVAVSKFESGQTYLLHTQYGYLSADSGGLRLIDSQSTAQDTSGAQWTATVNSDGTVTLKNKTGQTFYYDNYTFKASSNPGSYRNLRYENGYLYCYIDHGGWSETLYPVDGDSVASNVTYNRVLYTTNSSSGAMKITPYQQVAPQPEPEPEPKPDTPDGVEYDYYRITNTPSSEATVSFTVNKAWELGNLGHVSMYEALTVEMKLLENGHETGLVAELNLRNGWQYTFTGLPQFDGDGERIRYSVKEVPFSGEWSVSYGEVIPLSDFAYETTVTNTYHMTARLPETVGKPPYLYTLSGMLIILGALGWYCGQRRKGERRGG